MLFVSLAAHAAQFAFLLWFENPHIERTYGGPKKPLAARIPIDLSVPPSTASVDEHAVESNFSYAHDASTPGQTEGETETEPEIPELPEHGGLGISGVSAYSGVDSIDRSLERERVRRSRAMSTSIHDLTHRFFRNPVVICSNLDVFRATDFALVVLISYAVFALVPALPKSLGLAAHFLHALAWRLFHSYGLGLVLRAQSKTKWLVRHYLNNYPYATDDESDTDEETGADKNMVTRATEEAFQNWQAVYNISVVMTYISFAGLAWKTYHLPADWTISGTILRHVDLRGARRLWLVLLGLLPLRQGPLQPGVHGHLPFPEQPRAFARRCGLPRSCFDVQLGARLCSRCLLAPQPLVVPLVRRGAAHEASLRRQAAQGRRPHQDGQDDGASDAQVPGQR